VTATKGTVGALGEFGLVSAVVGRLDTTDDVLVGPGDDGALVRAPDQRVVATTDLLVEGRHFRRDWSSAHDIGRKAAAQSLADVAAMGARTTALLVGLGVPADLPSDWVLELADGLREECALVGAAVAGGDVVRSDRVTLGVSALGDLAGWDPVLRSGARPGDVVAVAGRLGWAAAGLAVLSRGFRSPRALVEAHRHPEPPYELGPAAARAGATSMIDVSDGLVADAGHVAQASGVVIALDAGLLPIEVPLSEAAGAFNLDPLAWVLGGGDDHALLATFPPDFWRPEGFVVVGVVQQPGGTGPGVLVDGRAYEGPAGHDHFG
jgi:thiamine-monophosphate kinase